jgi:pimeloyl-ACP methyl ester carboxylesterase
MFHLEYFRVQNSAEQQARQPDDALLVGGSRSNGLPAGSGIAAGLSTLEVSSWWQCGESSHRTKIGGPAILETAGSPWKKEYAKVYEEQSSITYAGAITTPTLILHDTGDPIVSIANSYLMCHALKDNGATVKFIAFPVDGHWPADHPVHYSDIHRVWLDWFDQYLK